MISWSSSAFETVIILSGCTSPITANPYLGSSSIIVCPPAMITFASLALFIPPSKIFSMKPFGRISEKQDIFNAKKGFPPIA